MIDVHFVFLGAVIGLAGTLLYARDTLRGLTQPNRVTWLMWTIAPMLALAVEIHQGVGLRALMTFVVGFGPLLVLLASFANRQSVWQLGPFDLACGLASAGGLLVWVVTQNDTVALVAFMAADGLAGLPTVVKSWKAPATESASAYTAGTVNAVLTLATVTEWNSATVAFPIQIVIFNLVEIVLISGRLGPRIRRESTEVPLQPIERVIAGARQKELP